MPSTNANTPVEEAFLERVFLRLEQRNCIKTMTAARGQDVVESYKFDHDRLALKAIQAEYPKWSSVEVASFFNYLKAGGRLKFKGWARSNFARSNRQFAWSGSRFELVSHTTPNVASPLPPAAVVSSDQLWHSPTSSSSSRLSASTHEFVPTADTSPQSGSPPSPPQAVMTAVISEYLQPHGTAPYWMNLIEETTRRHRAERGIASLLTGEGGQAGSRFVNLITRLRSKHPLEEYRARLEAAIGFEDDDEYCIT